MKAIKDMTQFEFARLESMVARSLHTHKRFITIDTATPLSGDNADLRVILRGGFVYRLVTDGTQVSQLPAK